MATRIVSFITVLICSLWHAMLWASSADAWKSYQEGRNPAMEVVSIIVGIVVIGAVLYGINKINESMVRKRRAKRRKKR